MIARHQAQASLAVASSVAGPRHHPDEAWILAHAAGTLDLSQATVIESHLERCPACRAAFSRAEAVGGALLESLAPAAMAPDALDRLMARLDAPDTSPSLAPSPSSSPAPAPAPAAPRKPASALDQILATVHGGPDLDSLNWRFIGPGVRGVRLLQGGRDDTRLWLLRAKGGAVMPMHSHNGSELVLVLKGAFTVDGKRFGPGDLEDSDDSTHHEPHIEAGEECICLAAIEGPLKLSGFARLFQPFIGI